MALFQPITQVRLTNVALVKLKKGGKRFEVPTYKNKILSWRAGNEEDFDEVVQIPRVFVNVSKGQYASKEDMKNIFGSTDEVEICKFIMKNGDVQVSEKEREVHLEALWSEVVQTVADKVYDLRSGTRLSPAVLENTLKACQFSVKSNIPAKRQALSAISTLIEQRGDIFGRFLMQLCVTVSPDQEIALLSMLEEVDAESVSTVQTRAGWHESTFVIHSAKYKDVQNLISKMNPPGKVSILDNHVTDSAAIHKAQAYASKSLLNESKVDMKFRVPPVGSSSIDDDLEGLLLGVDNSLSNTVKPGHIARPNAAATTHLPHRPPVIPQALLSQQQNFKVPETLPSVVDLGLPSEPSKQDAPAPAPTTSGGRPMVCSTCKFSITGGASAFREHSREDWHVFNVKAKVRNLEPFTEEVYEAMSPKERLQVLAASSSPS